MSVGDYIRNSQVWRSVFRHPAPTDRRNRVVVMLTNFFLHLHPVSINQQGIALSYTWCMGGITFFLFLVETITGVLLMFYYRPTLEWAFADIQALRGPDAPNVMYGELKNDKLMKAQLKGKNVWDWKKNAATTKYWKWINSKEAKNFNKKLKKAIRQRR